LAELVVTVLAALRRSAAPSPGARLVVRPRQAIASLLVVGALVAALASAEAVQAAAPDAHDRALAAALDARVATFRAFDTASFGASESKALHSCVPLEKGLLKDKGSLGKAFSGILTAALDLALPLTIDLADRYESELSSLRVALTAMHPDSTLFGQWRTAELRSLNLFLGFANHAQLVDPCSAATYMQGLAKISKAGMAAALVDFQSKVGISLAQFQRLAPSFYSNSDPATALSSLAQRMGAFFVAAGLDAKDAGVLSSSE